MSRVQRMDRSAGHAVEVRWIAPEALPMREPAQVLDRREDRPWPFLYTYREDGRCVVNTAPRKSAYAQIQDIGEALI